MATFSTDLILNIDPFEAEDEVEANAMIDKYVDLLAYVIDQTLTWHSCDWNIVEVDANV